MTSTEDELARPLTAEEEAELRWALGSPVGTDTQPTRVLRRLLATLDALRALPVADTAGIDVASWAAGVEDAVRSLKSLTFAEFAAVNRARCEAPDGFGHPVSAWSLSDWFLAATGEFGEAANKAKKLNRVRDGIPGNTETPDELRAGLADEIADAVIYLDLLAQSQGLDLGSVVASKFNRTSEKIGAPHRLAAALRTPKPEGEPE